VAFPTDTVYGVGCDPWNRAAIQRLYEVKGRRREKAIPLLLSAQERATLVSSTLPDSARKLAAHLWPGALTLVIPSAATLPAELGDGETIAVRVPNHAALLSFIESCGGAIAASSANISGMPDAVTAQKVAEYFDDRVDLIVDGGRVQVGLPSTVVDCTVQPPRVLREGAFSAELIFSTLHSED
jgi:L-threonylcarbamoyladenylate synthase